MQDLDAGAHAVRVQPSHGMADLSADRDMESANGRDHEGNRSTRASAYFAREVLPDPQWRSGWVRELAADGFPAAVTCPVLRVSRSGSYEWYGRPPSARRRLLRSGLMTDVIAP